MHGACKKFSRREVLRISLKGAWCAGLLSLLPFRTARAVTPKISERWERESEEMVSRIRTCQRPHRSVLAPLREKRESAGDHRRTVQELLERVAKSGGGRVIIPAGDWFIKGPLHLRSNIELHLLKGSKLTFSENPSDYLPVVPTRWEGVDVFTLSPLIYAYTAHNVAVTGEGTICGNGALARARGMTQSGLDQDKLRMMGDEGIPVSKRIFGEGHILPPSLMQVSHCEQVLVEGVEIIDIPFWGVHLLYSRDVTVRDIKIESMFSNNDGIDIDSSERVLVEGCTFITGDDCIAIKSGRDGDGRRVNKPSREIVIRNCHMRVGSSGGIAVGSEMSGGVSDVYVLRCKMDSVGGALNIKSNLDRGGYVERVRMGKISIEECDTVFGVTTSYHSYRGGRFIPRIRDIKVADIWCQRAQEGISVITDTSASAEGISAESIRVDRVTTPITIQNGAPITVVDVSMNGVKV